MTATTDGCATSTQQRRREPRPCSAAEAVIRARRVLGKGGQYVLGTGDYHPITLAGKLVDLPWTSRDGHVGSDCWGFAFDWCYKVPRHRPGFASGRVPLEYRDQSDVDDDLNCNSGIEDALTDGDLFEIVTSGVPQEGDLLVFASLRMTLADGSLFKNIGHVGIVIGNARATEWDWEHPPYRLLDIAQCKGPGPRDGKPGRSPAVIQTDGSLWERHDEVWPKKAHRTFVLRVRP